jgi:hypothetical protein
MIVVLTVMSGMDLSHDYLGGLVGMVRVGSSRSGSGFVAGGKPMCMFWL